jgi:hypothetical protein
MRPCCRYPPPEVATSPSSLVVMVLFNSKLGVMTIYNLDAIGKAGDTMTVTGNAGTASIGKHDRKILT